jgi:hypothetical protein
VAKSKSSSKEGLRVYLKGGKFKFRSIYIFILTFVVLLSIGGYRAYSKYDDLKRENQKLSNPEQAARQESERIKSEVARLIDVPQEEDPTIATVVDASKLTGQAFFKNAQNGDKVLMYAQAKKAILYRPSITKIIEVAPINIGDNQNTNKDAQPEPAPAQQPANAHP